MCSIKISRKGVRMNMQNVLVTGANGFVGSAICDRLLGMNKSVVGLVRDRNYKSRRLLIR